MDDRVSALGEDTPRPEVTTGTLIANRYRVERELGRGGMANVYLAHDSLLERPVALKMMLPELAHSVALERFTHEIAVVGRLAHAHIVPLHDSGVHAGLPFYVMAYIEGESLGDRLRRERQLPIHEVVRIGTQVADALQYAHREGVLHRDIKPGNIMLADGNAYLADFGIARAIRASTVMHRTATGLVVGTPAYMSPEQAEGERDYDGRSDIFSLACVLYEALTGVAPFSGATPQAALARRFGAPPPRCSSLRDSVPPSLSEAIARAMSIVPADRFRGAAEFGAALAGSVTPMSVPRVAAHSNRVRPRFFAVVVGGALCTLAVILFAAQRWPALTDQVRGRSVARARSLIADGRWTQADSMLRELAADNPRDARVHLWLAQARSLMAATSDSAPDDWRTEALLAADQRASLDTLERLRLDALLAAASGRPEQARALYARVVASEPGEASARLALADTYILDSLVVPDSTSRSGFRFRSSWEAAARTLVGALELRSRSPSLRLAAYQRLSSILFILPTRYRRGRGDSRENAPTFVAFPALENDTLLFVPYGLADASRVAGEASNATLTEALARNRSILARAATTWVEDIPDSPDAHRALASALSASADQDVAGAGRRSALSEIRLAREHARDANERIAFSALEVRILLRARHYAAARALADSLLTAPEPESTQELELLASLAALTGRPERAAQLWRGKSSHIRVQLDDGRLWEPPPSLAGASLSLQAYGALGGPADSIRALRQRVDDAVRREVAPASWPSVRKALLGRPLLLAAPALGPTTVVHADPGGDRIGRMAMSLATGRLSEVRQGLAHLDSLSSVRDAGSMSPDGAYLLAWLRLAVGDTAGAEVQMDALLESMRVATEGSPSDMIASAMFVRLMRQRAEVASARGDYGVARRWAAAVDTLWGRRTTNVKERTPPRF